MRVPMYGPAFVGFLGGRTGESGLDSAGQLVGSRWDLANRIIHGIAPATPTIAT